MSTSPHNKFLEQIHRSVRGDQSSFKLIYDSYKNSLFAICLRYSNDRAESEDWLQEGFINIYKYLKSYDANKGSFYTWASKIMVNTILMDKRKKRITVDSIDQVEPVNATFEDNILSELEYKKLVQLIQKLPDGFRTVFNLYVIEGYTHREIGDLLGIAESTSKTQYMRARNALQVLVKEEYLIKEKLTKYIG